MLEPSRPSPADDVRRTADETKPVAVPTSRPSFGRLDPVDRNTARFNRACVDISRGDGGSPRASRMLAPTNLFFINPAA